MVIDDGALERQRQLIEAALEMAPVMKALRTGRACETTKAIDSPACICSPPFRSARRMQDLNRRIHPVDILASRANFPPGQRVSRFKWFTAMARLRQQRNSEISLTFFWAEVWCFS